MSYRSRKVCAGEYEITCDRFPGKRASVSKVHYPNDGDYWIYTLNFYDACPDPFYTKRDAIQAALYMMETY